MQLLIFIKNPEPGNVKTRLAESIGDDGALRVYRELLKITHDVTRSLPWRKHLFYSDRIDETDQWEPEVYEKHIQTGTDMGERMENALNLVLSEHSGPCIVIGSDCPGLSFTILQAAFVKLQNHDLVIGPANDGGYYLLGMNKVYAELFRQMPWSTDMVLLETLNRAKTAGLTHYMMPELPDIDTLQDLQLFPHLLDLATNPLA